MAQSHTTIEKLGFKPRYAITYNTPLGQGRMSKKGRQDRIKRGLAGRQKGVQRRKGRSSGLT